ncbi:hypothetical protein ACLB2K_017202 [Fragaria x ananassa]
MEASETAESIHLSDDTEEAIHLFDTEEAIHLSDIEDNETDEPIDLEVSWEDVLDYRKLTVEDVLAKAFKTLEEAEKFYYSYALAIGFGPRRDTSPQMDRAHMRLRNNQVRDDFNTMNSILVIETHLEDLEGHAASTYTYDVYKWVKKEIMKEKFLVIKGFQAAAEDDHSVHEMANFKRQQYVHEVVYYHGRLTTDEEALEEAVLPPIMVCTCNMFQYKGVPCRHMFMLMKQENMSKIPRSLIMKRWTRNAGSVCDIEYPDGENMDKEALEVRRFGALTGDCNRMCSYASKTTKGYSMLKKEIARLTALIEGLVKDSEQVHVCDPQPERTGCVIRDPVVVKKKGNQNQETGRRPITCSYCKGAGHNIQSCGERNEKEREAVAHQSLGEDNPPSVSTPAKKVYHCDIYPLNNREYERTVDPMPYNCSLIVRRTGMASQDWKSRRARRPHTKAGTLRGGEPTIKPRQVANQHSSQGKNTKGWRANSQAQAGTLRGGEPTIKPRQEP